MLIPATASGQQYKHFSVDTLSNGVYAAVHRIGGGAICKAGIVDLGEETLVFDCPDVLFVDSPRIQGEHRQVKYLQTCINAAR